MKFFQKIYNVFLLIFLPIIFSRSHAVTYHSVDWHPSGNYFAAGGADGTTNDILYIYSYNTNTNSFTLTDSRRTAANYQVRAVKWSPNGNYLAVGVYQNSATAQFRIYPFNGSRIPGSALVTQSYTNGVDTVYPDALCWHPYGSYIALGGGNNPAGTNFTLKIYAFNGSTLVQKDSKTLIDMLRDIQWDSTGTYLITGGNANAGTANVYTYTFANSKLSSTYTFSKNLGSGAIIYNTSISPDARFAVICGNNVTGGKELMSYSFNKGVLSGTAIDSRSCYTYAIAARFHPNQQYVAIGGHTPDAGQEEAEIYGFDMQKGVFTTNPIVLMPQAGEVRSIDWSIDGRFILMGGGSDVLRTYRSYYKGLGLYAYDGTVYNIYKDTNEILRDGENAIGWVGFRDGITIPAGAGAKLNIELPLSNGMDLRTSCSLILENNLFLDSEVTLSGCGSIYANGKTIFLNGDARLSENSVLEFISNAVVDGQGHDLILDRYAQLLVDGGVTVTFKNMTIKNTLNTISCPPIRCIDWYSQACFDNVIFALNDDWAFRNGQFYIYNDVECTGTSKFSYRSVRPSYITQHSSLIFDPQTTFEYYPSSTDNSLIKMTDKTSAIIFDDGTLQTTHTGIRLTKGSLCFDNDVTLSSNANKTFFTGLVNLGVSVNFSTRVRFADWSPDGRYLAVVGENGSNDIVIYSWNGDSLTAITSSLDFGSGAYVVKWSPDGKYLAVGGSNGSTDLVIYRWDGVSLTALQSLDFGTWAVSISWSNDQKYLAVGGYNSFNGLVIYRWSGESLTITTSKYFGTNAYAVGWSPDNKYLAVGGYSPGNLVIYEWNGSTLTSKDTKSFTDRILGVGWNPTGKYLAVGGSNSGANGVLAVYEWNGSLLTTRDTESFGQYARGISWSPDGQYLAVSGQNGYNDFIVYGWNGASLTVTASKSFGTYAYSTNWTPDGNFVFVGGENGANDLVVYGVDYKFDISPQGFVNGIIFGDSAVGSSQDLEVYLLSAARVGIYGRVLQDSVNSSWNFQSRDSYVSLDRYDSQFKITNAGSVNNWKKNQIIKSSEPNTMFLQDNQVWGASTDFLAPEETFEFMNNLVIPDGQITQFSANAVIDGQGHDLILGKYAQLFVDGGITVTFKNMTIRNTLNTISCPPMRCMDWYSQACFDNVTFAFNDDWAFRNGQFFIHNDVEFTGTSKFSYRSVRPSYIASHSNLIFDSQTTFEYYPSTTDNALIKMADKTSALIFDGSTLQTTHTGIRLTRGSVYFDNKITLSSSDNTVLTSQVTALLNVTGGLRRSYAAAWRPTGQHVAFGAGWDRFRVSDYISGSNIYYDATSNNPQALAWDPTGKYLAIALANVFGNLKILEFEFNSYKGEIFNQDSLGSNIYDIDWSPDGKNVIWGEYDGNIKIAPFSNLQQNPAIPSYIFNKDMGNEIRAVAWNPDGEYIAWGNSVGNLEVYKYSDILANPTSPTYTFSQDLGSAFSYQALQWSPDGQYLVWVDGSNYVSIVTLSELKQNHTTPSYIFRQQVTDSICVAWSPNGAYLAVGSGISDGNLRIYSFDSLKGNPVSPTSVVIHNMGMIDIFQYGIYVLDWSPDGNNILVAGGNSTARYGISTFSLQYTFDTSPQGYSNGIIFGNSTLGSVYDLKMYILGGANVIVDGKIWYDDTI